MFSLLVKSDTVKISNASNSAVLVFGTVISKVLICADTAERASWQRADIACQRVHATGHAAARR